MNLPPKVRQKTFWGIFMGAHHSLVTKQEIIRLYREGYGCVRISKKVQVSESQVKRLVNRYLKYGLSGLTKLPTLRYSPALKLEVVGQVLEKCLSCEHVALQYKISESAVARWVRLVRANGSDSLSLIKPHGRPPKIMERPRKTEPQTELEILKEKVARLEAENALLKKVKALVEQRDAQLQKIGQKPSKN